MNTLTPVFLGHVSRVAPSLRADGLLRPWSTGRHGQRPDSLEHRPEQPPRQVTLGQQEPVVTGVPDQPSARLEEALLETWSATKCRSAPVAPAAARDSQGCSQHAQLQPDLVRPEAVTRPPRPVCRLLPL